ncbi:hypothetical protein [Massilia sp. TS11]|uniref:hypothetical protein n=1 Tax=Massilia sp. TS11 TaxID=2908003 RepID=UPI001EDAD8D1|nr:hypothetical protein [Massilia sp. TS11]MCG2583613.1 hypothetical protein [Massilia sp. TS11]
MSPSTLLILKPSLPLRLALWALLALALLLFTVEHMWGNTGDLAHHYALVTRLMENWGLAHAGDVSLGEMNYYPRASHVLAAVLGSVLGSPLAGLHVLSLLAVFTVWGALAAIVFDLPKRIGRGAALVLVLLLSVNALSGMLDLHGGEIVINYFYAQLVGQAGLLALLRLWQGAEARGMALGWRYLLLVPGALLINALHLLPGLMLLAMMALLLLLEWQLLAAAGWRQQLRSLALPLLCTAVAALLVHSSEAYQTMRSLGNHDGWLELALYRKPSGVAGAALLLAAISAALLWVWRRQAPAERHSMLSLKYAGALGLACAALCLLQYLMLLVLHEGSPYAVKKYAFTINSLLLLNAALGAGLLLARTGRTAAPTRNLGLGYAYLGPLAVCAIASLSVLPQYAIQSASALVRTEHQLQVLRDSTLPDTPGRYTYVIGLPYRSAIVDYMFSLGVFTMARNANGNALIGNRPLEDWYQVGNVVTAEGSMLDRFPACRRGAPRQGLVVLDGSCLDRQLGGTRQLIGFRASDSPHRCKLKGFSIEEVDGSWTVGKQAELDCAMPRAAKPQPTRVEIESEAFLAGASQDVQFSLNGGAPVSAHYTQATIRQKLELALPQPLPERLVLRIEILHPSSPTAEGKGHDDRQLGIQLRQLRFQ